MCMSKKGEGGWVHLKGANSMAVLCLAVESPWSALGGQFLSSFAHMGLENGVLTLQGLYFWR